MTTEEAVAIIEATESDYMQKQRILRGLTILEKYSIDLDLSIAFEHDQMWAGDFEATVANMTEEEVREMKTLGWFEDQESWSHY